MNSENQPKVFAHYGRVSTSDQKDHGTSLETQLQCAVIKAGELGGTIPEDQTIQEDWSGTDLNRPGLQQLYRIAEAGNPDGLIIHTLDRLYRPENDGDEWHVFEVMERIQNAGLEIIWTDPTLPSQGPMSAIFTFLNSWKSGQERRSTLERTRRGRLAIAGKGGLLGGFVPYGYSYVPKTNTALATLTIEKEQACHVREIFRLLVEDRLFCPAIAVILTDSGIPTATGNRAWDPSVVHQMLSQEAYCGVMYFNRREPVVPKKRRKANRSGKSLKSSRKFRPREEWIPIPVPAIIDRQTWEAAQVQLKSNAKFSPRNNGKRQFLLTSLVKCGICGKGYSGSGMEKRSKEYRYYYCTDKYPIPVSGVDKCPSPTIPADVLEQAIWQAVTEILYDPELLKNEFQERSAQQPGDQKDSHCEDLLAEQKQLKKTINRFLDLYGSGRWDIDTLNEKVDQARYRLDVIDKELANLEARERGQHLVAQAWENLEDFCLTVREGLDNMTFEERQQLLRLVLNRATIRDKSHVSIELAIPTGPDKQSSRLRLEHPPPSPPKTRTVGALA